MLHVNQTLGLPRGLRRMSLTKGAELNSKGVAFI